MATRICRRCLLPLAQRGPDRVVLGHIRVLSSKPIAESQSPDGSPSASASELVPKPGSEQETEEPGAMTRRLTEATESALSSGRGGRRAVEEAVGFDPDLKAALLSKISAASLDPLENSGGVSSATMSMPSVAGQGTREAALGNPWKGEEETADTVLRMLDDARKPLSSSLRGKANIPSPKMPNPVDLRPSPRTKGGSGVRIANAKEKAAAYADLGLKDAEKEKGLSDEEKEAMKKEFRERFAPGARSMPSTISGLAEMANRRIEDAIARGQFKNIPRGKGVERDTRADNPFIDTTEYIMNKMIQRQDLVPPWIEKQQELSHEARTFRTRLRSDWKRHAARVISSRGGTLEQQVARAEEYARAEAAYNPRRPNGDVGSETLVPDIISGGVKGETSATTIPPGSPDVRPFRDPNWELTEKSYHELAISKLNSLARSYNLMAPEMARKPYFSLTRELKACFADVAPEVPKAIRDRAVRANSSVFGSGPGSFFGSGLKIGGGGGGNGIKGDMVPEEKEAHDDKGAKYGLRQLWRDLWKPPKQRE